MMDDVVVVFRTRNGEDMIGLYISDKDNKVKIQNPHYLRYNNTMGIVVVPYCLFSDESYFDFIKDDLLFIVTASKSISTKYMHYIQNSLDEPLDLFINHVPGNDTIH